MDSLLLFLAETEKRAHLQGFACRDKWTLKALRSLVVDWFISGGGLRLDWEVVSHAAAAKEWSL